MKIIAFLALTLAVALAVQTSSQTAIQSTGPADVLLDHLESIQTDIRLEQFEHDTLYNTQHQECEDEFEARTTSILDGEDAFARSSAHHARCESSYLQSEADLAQVEAYQSQIAGILQGLLFQRTTQHDDFNVLITEELEPAIAAVQGAFPIIDSFSTGQGTFLEITRHMGQSFKTLIKAGKGASMAAPLTALAALDQEFDADSIAEVRRLFENLEQDLIDSKVNAVEVESNRVAVYDETVLEYEGIQTNLESTAAQLVIYSADMSACVVQEGAIIDESRRKVRNNSEALRYAIQMCGAFEEEYTNATNGRTAELTLLGRLTEFVQEQAEIFGDYGVDNSGVFDSYQNQYEQQLEAQVASFVQVRADKNKDHLMRMKLAISSF